MLKGKFVVTTDAILKGLVASEERTKERKKGRKPEKKKEVMIDETEDEEDESEGEQYVIRDCITVER